MSEITVVLMDEEEEEETCPICTDVYEKEDIKTIQFGCGHKFHSRCIMSWIDGIGGINGNTSRCPQCRREVFDWEEPEPQPLQQQVGVPLRPPMVAERRDNTVLYVTFLIALAMMMIVYLLIFCEKREDGGYDCSDNYTSWFNGSWILSSVLKKNNNDTEDYSIRTGMLTWSPPIRGNITTGTLYIDNLKELFRCLFRSIGIQPVGDMCLCLFHGFYTISTYVFTLVCYALYIGSTVIYFGALHLFSFFWWSITLAPMVDSTPLLIGNTSYILGVLAEAIRCSSSLKLDCSLSSSVFLFDNGNPHMVYLYLLAFSLFVCFVCERVSYTFDLMLTPKCIFVFSTTATTIHLVSLAVNYVPLTPQL